MRGDPVIVVEYHKADRPAYVARVGRDYIYIADTPDGSELNTRFHRDSGVQDTQTGWKAVLFTPEQREESLKRRGLLAELRRAGVEIRDDVLPDMSTATLTALLAVVRPTDGEVPV
jgi:hypothetical protein